MVDTAGIYLLCYTPDEVVSEPGVVLYERIGTLRVAGADLGQTMTATPLTPFALVVRGTDLKTTSARALLTPESSCYAGSSQPGTVLGIERDTAPSVSFDTSVATWAGVEVQTAGLYSICFAKAPAGSSAADVALQWERVGGLLVAGPVGGPLRVALHP